MELKRNSIGGKILKNKKLARIIASSISKVYGKGYKAIPTDDGWIVGRKFKRAAL